MESNVQTYREFLKDDLWAGWDALETDHKRRMPPPLPQKPHPQDAMLINLIGPDAFTVGSMSLIETIRRRRSHRRFSPQPLTREDLSFLLWATQGIKQVLHDGWITRRTVPAGGSFHPFETYLYAYPDRVEGLAGGLYRYLALEHQLCLLCARADLADKVTDACSPSHRWVRECAALFIWTALPYRKEWHYSILAHKLIALDAGHVCQNVYLACEAIGAGACALGAYSQREMDAVVGVDGEEEFVIYTAAVGKTETSEP